METRARSVRRAAGGRTEPVLVLSPHAAITGAPTAGVRIFERCPPVHCVLLGRCRIHMRRGEIVSLDAIAIPANVRHRVTLEGPYACVAYLDPRRHRLEDVERLAERWRGFAPGRDDPRSLARDAGSSPAPTVDPRILRALDALEIGSATVADAAASVGLSVSRLTHLVTETLGAPPRTWRAWLRLRRAISEVMFEDATLTEAAHRAGFADSAHLTRTCKQLTGVRPAQMMPRRVYVER
jgi:AraC-like DNA-binding protein/mannose-6-phosphate isomerase-like protein (cupin superfamily)